MNITPGNGFFMRVYMHFEELYNLSECIMSSTVCSLVKNRGKGSRVVVWDIMKDELPMRLPKPCSEQAKIW
jgi:hypothetical protein